MKIKEIKKRLESHGYRISPKYKFIADLNPEQREQFDKNPMNFDYPERSIIGEVCSMGWEELVESEIKHGITFGVSVHYKKEKGECKFLLERARIQPANISKLVEVLLQEKIPPYNQGIPRWTLF